MSTFMDERFSQEDNEFEVQAIISEKISHGIQLFKVRWKGFGPEDDTWEPESNLHGCEELLKSWKERFPIRGMHRDRKLESGATHIGRQRASKSTKRHYDAMEIDGQTPERSGSSSSEIPSRPAKTLRKANNQPVPGTTAYIRWRENQLLDESPRPMHPDRVKFLEKLGRIPGPPITLYNDVDDDPSPPVFFEFVERYKMGEGVVDFVKENADFWAGCTCTGGKCKSDCSCVTENNGTLYYDKHGRIAARFNRENGRPINECNEKCSCDLSCPNRVVQRGRKIPLEIFKTEKKGWGLRCPQKIPRGTFIDTYPGELITTQEADIRVEKYNKTGLSYLFDLDKFSKVQPDEDEEDDPWADLRESEVEVVNKDEIYVVDGHNYGGVTRFINHSCDPSLLIWAVTRERADYRLYDLAMFAARDIPAYEELTFSYVAAKKEDRKPDDAAEGEEPVDRWECFCGAPNCAKYLW